MATIESVPLVEKFVAVDGGDFAWIPLKHDKWPADMADTIGAAKSTPGTYHHWTDGARHPYRVMWSVPMDTPNEGIAAHLNAVNRGKIGDEQIILTPPSNAGDDSHNLRAAPRSDEYTGPPISSGTGAHGDQWQPSVTTETLSAEDAARFDAIPKGGAEGPLPAGGLDEGPDVSGVRARVLVEVWNPRSGGGPKWEHVPPVGADPYPPEVVAVINAPSKTGRVPAEPVRLIEGKRIWRVTFPKLFAERAEPKAAPAPTLLMGLTLRERIATAVYPIFLQIANDTGSPQEGNEKLTRWAADRTIEAADILLAALAGPPLTIPVAVD